MLSGVTMDKVAGLICAGNRQINLLRTETGIVYRSNDKASQQAEQRVDDKPLESCLNLCRRIGGITHLPTSEN